MKEKKDIEAELKFELKKVNDPKPAADHSVNGGSGSPCCGGGPGVPGPPIRHDPLP